ncbi:MULTISPECIES: glycosyltransferase [Protofrankia]|uniref:Glycosyltransferase, MGT family n=1 Tax=Candidatus Protofrankia datiscae TaxID=2716812 RepID=F8B166_9ACTN|nr:MULTISPECIES: glycosyltransferase [Protofrankia]AEH08802.1 glycosyltransferase, MGT family [Candidatus Protofrankia datiscae]
MSRFLFVVPPLTGHVNPAVGIAGELAGRGHKVAVAGHPDVVGPLLTPGLTLLPFAGTFTGPSRAAVEERSRQLRGAASLKFLWEDFLIPLAASMVVDQQAVGAALVARRRALPWATLAATSAELDDPYELLPGVGRWVRDTLRDFQRSQGVSEDKARVGDLRFSEHLTLVCSVPRMLRTDSFPSYYGFVGIPLGRRPAVAFPWEWLDPEREHVLVSLGTVTREAGGRFLRVAVDALRPLGHRLQAIVVAPPGILGPPRVNPAPDGAAVADGAPADGAPVGAAQVGVSRGGGAEEHILVLPHVPQLDLMPRLSAVVSHGGNNTVCEALAHGVPLVVAPVRDDQPVIGEQVVRTGAGLRVRFGRVSAPALRESIVSVLDEPSFRVAARRLRGDFAAAGGAVAAADRLLAMI